jgi:hypothetical protein
VVSFFDLMNSLFLSITDESAPPAKKAKSETDLSNILYDTTKYAVSMDETQKTLAEKVLDDFKKPGHLTNGNVQKFFDDTKDYQRQFLLLSLSDHMKKFGWLE